MFKALTKLLDFVFPAPKLSHEHGSGDVSKCPFMNGSMSETPVEVAQEAVVVAAPEPELSKLGKIRKSFNSTTDLLAISMDYKESKEVTAEEKEWLEKLGDRVIYFDGNSLVNVGVVKTSAPYYSNFYKK